MTPNPNERPPVPGLVTVVTAAYNMGGYIAETLDSILGQDYLNVESVVIDDGSTDNTAAVLARYAADPRVRVIRQANAGQTVAKNRGIAEARGEFVAFCDADDVWDCRKLSRQVPEFLRADDVAVVFSEIDCIDAEGRPLPAVSMRRYDGHITAQLLIDNFVPFPSVVVRASVLHAMGGFDERLTMSIDYDLWLRISTRYRFVYVPEVLAHYRIWPGQMSHRTGERLDNFFRLLQRFVADHPHAASRLDVDRAYGHVHVTRGDWHASEGRRSAAWADYRCALLLDPLSVRTWKRTIALLLGHTRGGTEASG
jgi:glycosyltransferase involved in cell wall biosynthesis